MKPRFITYRGVVYPWQCAHMRHMSTVWYAGKVDEATWNFFAKTGFGQKNFVANNRGMAALETKYKSEVVAGEAVDIHTHLTRITAIIVKFIHQMFVRGDDRIAAVFEVVAVHLDTDKRKAFTLPESVASKGKRFLAVERRKDG